MDRLVFCLTHEHDPSLVLAAVLVCALGIAAQVTLSAPWRRVSGRMRWAWGAAALLTATCTVWATHFIAMLAFFPAATASYGLLLTAASLVLLTPFAGFGLLLVAHGSVLRRAAGGAVFGLGVAAMHFTGMAAMRVPGTLVWDHDLIGLAIVLGVSLGALAAVLWADRRVSLKAAGAAVLLIAVCALHFTAMAALRVIAYGDASTTDGQVAPRVLAGLVGGVVLMLLATAAIGADSHRRLLLRRLEERLRLGDLADIAIEGLIICRGETIVATNESLRGMLGVASLDLIGRPLWALLPELTVETLGIGPETEATLLAAADQRIPVRVTCRPITLGTAAHMVVAVRDQRGRLAAEAAMSALAHADPLTGLANRIRFREALQERTQSIGGDVRFAVLMIDLDRFKPVNDTLGLAGGDTLLRLVSGRLQSALRSDDLLARLGGDEFAIIVGSLIDADAAGVIGARVIDILGRPFLIDGHVIDISASVGVAIAPDNGQIADDLMRNADLALYQAKSEGGGRWRLFEAQMDARVQARRALERDLRRAVARRAFELHYQPLVSARTRSVVGAEALIRWRDPERGLIAPGVFIPISEETGLIGEIGEWALRTACEEAATWPNDLAIAVNLSPLQFRDPKLADIVGRVLEASALSPSRLELEVTESAMLDETGRTLATLKALHALGVRISMDDFGTGYSSLAYLRLFPFDKLKIDRSFISQAPDDREAVAIVRAIIQLGTCLGMKTTVEGVETNAQFDFTVAEGCDQIKGYLVSRPLPSTLFAVFLSQSVAA